MKSTLFLNSFFCSLFMTGCATFSDLELNNRYCALSTSGKVLIVKGPTDSKMFECFKRTLKTEITQIEINSNGGNVELAILSAELLAKKKLHIIIDKNCNSSCANYFLPVASRITLKPHSQILLHGSVDEGLIEIQRAKFGKRPQDDRVQLLQKEFAKNYNIHLGWLLYRTHYDGKDNSFGQYVKGNKNYWGLNLYTDRFTIVEEKFMRSCLPNVKIDIFQDTKDKELYINTDLKSRYSKLGIFPSGDMVCIDKNNSNKINF
jgi:hypothetical protein